MELDNWNFNNFINSLEQDENFKKIFTMSPKEERLLKSKKNNFKKMMLEEESKILNDLEDFAKDLNKKIKNNIENFLSTNIFLNQKSMYNRGWDTFLAYVKQENEDLLKLYYPKMISLLNIKTERVSYKDLMKSKEADVVVFKKKYIDLVQTSYIEILVNDFVEAVKEEIKTSLNQIKKEWENQIENTDDKEFIDDLIGVYLKKYRNENKDLQKTKNESRKWLENSIYQWVFEILTLSHIFHLNDFMKNEVSFSTSLFSQLILGANTSVSYFDNLWVGKMKGDVIGTRKEIEKAYKYLVLKILGFTKKSIFSIDNDVINKIKEKTHFDLFEISNVLNYNFEETTNQTKNIVCLLILSEFTHKNASHIHSLFGNEFALSTSRNKNKQLCAAQNWLGDRVYNQALIKLNTKPEEKSETLEEIANVFISLINSSGNYAEQMTKIRNKLFNEFLEERKEIKKEQPLL